MSEIFIVIKEDVMYGIGSITTVQGVFSNKEAVVECIKDLYYNETGAYNINIVETTIQDFYTNDPEYLKSEVKFNCIGSEEFLKIFEKGNKHD